MHRKKRARTSKTTEVVSELTPSKSPQVRAKLSKLKIQTCAFFKWPVSPINTVAISPNGALVAIARSGCIELRDRSTIWAPVGRTYADTSNPELAITGLQFSPCGKYLVAGRLDGVLFIYRIGIHSIEEHTRLQMDGGAIWSIDICRDDPESRAPIAVACDDGYVRIVSRDPSAPTDAELYPSNSEFYIVRITEANSARALCVSWAPSSVGGSDGCVVCGDAEGGLRWLNATNGSAYGHGKIASLRGEPVSIWTCKFVSGGREVICGDSRGMVSVWSTAMNSITAELTVEGLEGTIWSAVCSPAPNGDIVILGSAGGGIGGVKAQLVEDGVYHWLPIRATRLHSHDVRSLSGTADGFLVSGSMDARCCLFRASDLIEKKEISRIYPYMDGVGQSTLQFMDRRSLGLSRHGKCIECWFIPPDQSSPTLELKMDLKSFKSEVKSCAMSEDCAVIAACSEDAFRVYDVPFNPREAAQLSKFGKISLRAISATCSSRLRGAIEMAFCHDSLICISRCAQFIYAYKDDRIMSFSKEEVGASTSLAKLVCRAGRVAVSDVSGKVFYSEDINGWAKPDVKWSVIFTPQSEVATVCAMQFSKTGRRLAVATRDFKLHTVMTIEVCRGSSTTHRHSFPQIASYVSFSNDENSVLVSGSNFCHIVGVQGRSVEKRKADGRDGPSSGVHVLPYRKAIIGSAVLGRSRMVVAYRPWRMVEDMLPDAMYRKVYGR